MIYFHVGYSVVSDCNYKQEIFVMNVNKLYFVGWHICYLYCTMYMYIVGAGTRVSADPGADRTRFNQEPGKGVVWGGGDQVKPHPHRYRGPGILRQ